MVEVETAVTVEDVASDDADVVVVAGSVGAELDAADVDCCSTVNPVEVAMRYPELLDKDSVEEAASDDADVSASVVEETVPSPISHWKVTVTRCGG